MNFDNLSNEKMELLLKMAAAKLGTSSENLRQQIQSGNFNLPNVNREKLQQVLSNPGVAEKLLNTPDAKELIKKLR